MSLFCICGVSEIRKLLNPDCWIHCADRDNPADIPSRGVTPKEMATSKLWMNGVLCDSPLSPMPECQTEMWASDPEKTIWLLTTTGLPSIGQLMKCADFSSLHHVTSKVLRFCQLLLSKIRKEVPAPSSDDLTKAETLWILWHRRC